MGTGVACVSESLRERLVRVKDGRSALRRWKGTLTSQEEAEGDFPMGLTRSHATVWGLAILRRCPGEKRRIFFTPRRSAAES
jgi:hypothetical protein